MVLPEPSVLNLTVSRSALLLAVVYVSQFPAGCAVARATESVPSVGTLPELVLKICATMRGFRSLGISPDLIRLIASETPASARSRAFARRVSTPEILVFTTEVVTSPAETTMSTSITSSAMMSAAPRSSDFWMTFMASFPLLPRLESDRITD